MSRERTLTIAGGVVALGMAGLLSLTAVNGRWLGVFAVEGAVGYGLTLAGIMSLEAFT